MKESVRHILIAMLFCLAFVQGGCRRAAPSRVYGIEDYVPRDRKMPSELAVYQRAVNESARDIPVAYDVDVAVVGGSSGGVAAAIEAAKNGARVFLLAQRPYLGEDLCSTYRLWLEPDEKPTSPLGSKLFAQSPATPMQIKRTLDEALLEAGVQFLFGCYATDVLLDGEGKIAGLVMANRSGRQAVRARVIIDATPRASVARIAGAAFDPYPSGLQTFRRVVVGGEPQSGEHIEARKMLAPMQIGDRPGPQPIEYTVKIAMKDRSFASFAEAEQVARDKTWHSGQSDASERLFQIPPDPVRGKRSLLGVWPGAEEVNLDVFRPKGITRLFVLGGCADISRDAAKKLLRPLELMKAGSRIGAAAASDAKSVPRTRDVRLRSRTVRRIRSGDIRENLSGIRPGPTGLTTIPADRRVVPVLGKYDVVVVGGGTGGAPAGISAARQGARTLVVEYLHGLGGVGTMGFISKYYYGYIEGFTKEIDEGTAAFGADAKPKGGGWNIEWKKQWYRSELRKAGADIWFGVLGCGAFVEDGCVKGVVVATPEGRGVILANVVIDSTGNADVAAAAGATCVYTNGAGLAVQGAGLPPRELGAGYTNTDWTFIDDADLIDVWRTFVVAKTKYKDAYDLGQLPDTRERRRIVGDFTMSPMDISVGRTYPDTITIARSNFDSHGFTIHPVFMLKPPDRKEMFVNVPYRCLLPKGLDGILVTGLGVSAHRDAMPVIRMQPDIQNQGYAAGAAAAMAVKDAKPVRDIDIEVLQKHLIEKGNLPDRVLTDTDSFPLPDERIAEAVDRVVNDFDGLEIVLSQPKQALPLLVKAYERLFGSSSKGPESEHGKLVYAHILGMLGDPSGASSLVDAVRSRDWDKGWNFTGMGQYGASLSELDSLIIALGRTRNKQALGPILEKLEQLDAGSEFSHCRAVAMALETMGDAAAAEPLARLLKKPGIQGHAFTDIDEARRLTPPDRNDTKTRNCSLRELILARALYLCGDCEGLGRKILKDYERDLRAHYARHARAVLKKEPAASYIPKTLERQAKDTLTAVEMNRGDTLKFELQNGQVREIVLQDTAIQVLEQVSPGGIVYRFTCQIRMDGQPMTLERYVCTQESFYEPYVVNGIRIWFDAIKDTFDLIPMRYPKKGNLQRVPRGHARFALQDATLRICPQVMNPWYPNDCNFIDIKDCYNGDDCWMGPYLGWACHGGLDINHSKGEPLWAPIDFDDQWLFNSLAGGHNNNRWRGIRKWPNGDVWALQTHHLIKLLVDEHTPIVAGTEYATAAGVYVGSHEHTHYEFKVGRPAKKEAPGSAAEEVAGAPIDFDDASEVHPTVIHLDPWILFWQIFQDNKDLSGEILAAMQPLHPVRTGEKVAFSAEGSRAGRGQGGLFYYWTFGDGGWSNRAEPEYTFVRPGVYPVTLVVDDGVNQASCTQHVTVDGEPVEAPALTITAPDELAFRRRPVNAMDVYGRPVRPIPHTLEFVARASRPVPNTKTVEFGNIGSGILPKVSRPGVRYLGSSGWLSLQVRERGDTQILDIVANAAGLKPGSHCAIVSVECPGAMNSPQGFRVVVKVPSTSPAWLVTIDDRDTEFCCTPYFWVGHRFSRCQKKGFRDFYLTNGGRAVAGEFARFAPDLQAGRYRVSLSGETPFTPGTAFDVRVRHRSGEEIVRVEPESSRLIGIFDFHEGADGFVDIMAGDSTGMVAIDAVAFERVSE